MKTAPARSFSPRVGDSMLTSDASVSNENFFERLDHHANQFNHLPKEGFKIQK